MQRKKLKYCLFSVLAILFFSSCENKLDWNSDYRKDNPQPYGAKSLYELMPGILGSKFVDLERDNPIFKRLPAYLQDSIGYYEPEELEYLDPEDLQSLKTFNLFLVRNYVELSPSDVNTIDLAVRKGSHVLLCGEMFSDYLQEFYGLELEDFNSIQVPDTALYNYPRLEVMYGEETFKVRSGAVEKKLLSNYVDDEVLLKTKKDDILAFKRYIGKGSVTFCTAPKLFTNIHFLYHSPKLVQKFYQNLPKQENLWGNDYHTADFTFRSSGKSLLSFIMRFKSLRWAWYLVLVGAALYILSNMKRIQKALLPKKLNENLSLKYIETVAMLYRKSKNNSEIYRKKVDMFNGALFEKYDVRKNMSANEKAKKLLEKTSKLESLENLESSFQTIEKAYLESFLNQTEFIEAFKAIETLKKKYL